MFALLNKCVESSWELGGFFQEAPIASPRIPSHPHRIPRIPLHYAFVEADGEERAATGGV